MTVINPPGFLQNAGATHTAEGFRSWLSALIAGRNNNTLPLVARGGVHPALGSLLQVTQSAAPAMSVVVKSGLAFIPGTQGAKQGVYAVENDADVTLTISAAHASLNRIDSVCFKVEDSAYSGVPNTSSLVVVTGTPSGSPAAPTLPDNALELAQVSVVALDTSITNGEITDKRKYLSGVGGVILCTSATRPGASTVGVGQVIIESDTSKMYITMDSGTTWSEVWTSVDRTAWQTWTPTLTNLTQGNGTITAVYKQVGKTVHYRFIFTLGTTSAVALNPRFTLPVAPIAGYGLAFMGDVNLGDTGVADRRGTIRFISGSTVEIIATTTTGTAVFTSSTSPHTWGSTDTISVTGFYEAA